MSFHIVPKGIHNTCNKRRHKLANTFGAPLFRPYPPKLFLPFRAIAALFIQANLSCSTLALARVRLGAVRFD
jgi:hypothetical protein